MPTPSAGTATVDLTASGNYGLVDDAVFGASQVNAGTGTFPAFLSIARTGTEQGYNSDFRPVQFNETTNANHNHSLLLANVPLVEGGNVAGTVEGVLYREFLFDSNEGSSGENPFLSLDRLQIYQELSGNLGGTYNFSSGPSGGFNVAGEHLVYDLDATGDHWIAVNSRLSSGSGKSDIQVLIPNSFFDPNVPYVYLYSAFGLQGDGWRSSGGSEEWAVAGGQSGQGGGSKAALNISKSAAVDGGTADAAGEVITYSMTLANTGNVSLTGITVSDPSVSDLTRGLDQTGNNDNILNVGEVWTYSAHHVVTQGEIDAAGGDGFINNTVSAGSDQTGHLLAQLDTASAAVAVESRPFATLDKEVSSITSTDEVPGTTVVDAAGDVINYTISVSWAPNGNTTLTNPVVSDPSINVNPLVDHDAPVLNLNAQVFTPVLDGDNNLGDNNNNGIADPTDQNNVRDPGETWQYVYNGDTNENGFHDPGETWMWTTFNLGDTSPQNGIHDPGETWVGDTNQNGIEEPGERWQFKNVWDTNSNGLQDNGEVWHYKNVGDDNQNGAVDPGETFVYYNAGDANQNGFEDAGETFQYYNVGDTNHNGVEDEGETFQFNHVVPGVDANEDGFNDGDLNQDGNINANETWLYKASYTVTQDDIDNRVDGVPTVSAGLTRANTATLNAEPQVTASDSVSVSIVQNPAFSIEKAVTDVGGDGSSGHVDQAGDIISYTITVANTGNMTLTGVTFDDPLLQGPHGTLSGATESLSANGELDVGETWTYTGTYTAQQSDINNNGGGDGDIDNTATAQVTQLEHQDPQSSSTETPIDRNPDYSILKTVTDVDGQGPPGHVDAAGDVIAYSIEVNNLGNVDLTGTSVTDALLQGANGTLSSPSGDSSDVGTLNVGETWTYTGTYTVQQSDIDNNGGGDGDIDNTATVQSDELADESSSTATPVDYNPSFVFSVAALGYDDNNTNNQPDGGDVINFSVHVTNTGNVTLTNLAISNLDGLITFQNGPIASLAPGLSDDTMTGTHLIQSGETSLDESQIGQSDQVGNVVLPYHLDFVF